MTKRFLANRRLGIKFTLISLLAMLAVVITGVGHAANNGDGDTLDAIGAVQTVNTADQAGCVAAGQLEVLLADTLFVVGITVKENICNTVFLAALEDSLDAFFIVKNLVFCTDTRR